MFEDPCTTLITELHNDNDERYQLDATITIYYHK